jgi:hypothetical protein
MRAGSRRLLLGLLLLGGIDMRAAQDGRALVVILYFGVL